MEQVAGEPPKYILELIKSINEGARAAQAGAIAFFVVGLYLVATAVSTTDEDLLLQHTTTISQIGVQVPLIINFAIGPIVFFAIHAYTLLRYDMLGVNLCQFVIDLPLMAPQAAWQERCRQLLANIEFVQSTASTAQYSRLYLVSVTLLLIFAPIFVLLVVQISFLRYQSDWINLVQRIAFVGDLLLICWFVSRQVGRKALRRPLPAYVAAILLLALNLLYLDVAHDGRWIAAQKQISTELQSELRQGERARVVFDLVKYSYLQPVDVLLCPFLHWGCRYLTVEHRRLVNRTWVPKMVTDMNPSHGELFSAVEGAEGIYLRDRSLRFASLEDSALYGAN